MFGWTYVGRERPPFASPPGPGQESVWDYPRPPRLERDPREVSVRAGGQLIARTTAAIRILETASPPTFYLPPTDVRTDLLEPFPGSSACEWKGDAHYWRIRGPESGEGAHGWSYENPLAAFEAIGGHFSFYPGRLECYVGSERVRPQPGGFYGGWLTSEIVGPVKGEPGSNSW